MTTGRIVLVSAAAALALIAPASADRPPAGSSFAGTTSQGKPIALKVTGSGHGLQLSFDAVSHCNRGPDKVAATVFRKQRPTIRLDGTFRYHKTYDLGPVPGFAERHTERQTVSGAFGKSGRTVHGSVRIVDTGRSGLRCVAKLTFGATRS
jgi:hypothetical protein